MISSGQIDIEQVEELRKLARSVRRWDLRTVQGAGLGHVGGEMSAADILVTLYFAVLNVNPARPEVHPPDYRFEIGKAARLREGSDVTLVANGVLVSRALEAAEMLSAEGVQARVLNMSTVRPLDRDAVISASAETGGIVTAEEHTVYGGLGSAVAEVVVQNRPVPMRILGVPGVFAPTGSAAWLLEHFGLTAQGIFSSALELVKARI